MKLFHISDILSVTTGRLVSKRHMDGVYDILNFLTGDDLYTHQLPRAITECRPWLRAQFPELMKDAPSMMALLKVLDQRLRPVSGPRDTTPIIVSWVEEVRTTFDLPEQMPVYELGAEMHTHIDPIDEAKAMVGDERVIAIKLPEES